MRKHFHILLEKRDAASEGVGGVGVLCPALLHTQPVSCVSDGETDLGRPGDLPHSQLLPLLSCVGGVKNVSS